MICKNYRSRTTVDQACDTRPISRSIKAISKKNTTENALFMGLKLTIQNLFKDLKLDNKIILSPTKEGALNNFLPSYPSIITNATTTSAIKSGFVYNDIVNDKATQPPV